MVERRSVQEFSLAHCTRATWKRMVLVTRLPFLFNRKGSLVTRTITTLPVDILDWDNGAFKVVGYELELARSPSSTIASSFKVRLQ